MATTEGWDAADAGERLARFRLPATGVRDKDALFQAIRDTLPLDPSLATSNWDGLLDSLTSGLADHGCENVVLLWPEAREMRAASPDDFATALELFDDVAERLSNPTGDAERSVHFAIVLRAVVPKLVVGACPFCEQGALGIRVSASGMRVVALCDECDAVWLDPAVKDGPHFPEQPHLPCPGDGSPLRDTPARWADRETASPQVGPMRSWERSSSTTRSNVSCELVGCGASLAVDAARAGLFTTGSAERRSWIARSSFAGISRRADRIGHV